jgi:hypothetical protein
MKDKITVTLDKTILERAKTYAKKTGIRLSVIIENYLDSLTSDLEHKSLSPKLQKIVGAVQLPDDFDEKKGLYSYFEDKHK